MIIQYNVGDLVASMVSVLQTKNFSDNTEFVAHGCNCHSAMGSGFAPQIAKAFPIVEQVDNEMYEKYTGPNGLGNVAMLGNFSMARVFLNMVVFNLYTQYLPGKDLRMNALETAFFNINRLLSQSQQKRPILHIPKIGAGIAGGDWDQISKVIDSVTPDIDIHVWVLSGTDVPKLVNTLDNIGIE